MRLRWYAAACSSAGLPSKKDDALGHSGLCASRAHDVSAAAVCACAVRQYTCSCSGVRSSLCAIFTTNCPSKCAAVLDDSFHNRPNLRIPHKPTLQSVATHLTLLWLLSSISTSGNSYGNEELSDTHLYEHQRRGKPLNMHLNFLITGMEADSSNH